MMRVVVDVYLSCVLTYFPACISRFSSPLIIASFHIKTLRVPPVPMPLYSIFFPLPPKQAFLTHNGQLLGSPFSSIRSSLDTAGLYPCVGLHSPGEAVRLNFGQRPFLFDLSASVAEEDSQERAAVAAVHVCPSLLRSLVKDYLLHQVLIGGGEGGIGDKENVHINVNIYSGFI